MARPGARKFDLGGEKALTPLGVLTLDGAWPGGWGQVLGGPNLRELSGIKLAGTQKKPDDSLPCRDTVSMLSGKRSFMDGQDVSRVAATTPHETADDPVDPADSGQANSSVSLTKHMNVPRAFFALADPVVEEVTQRARDLEANDDAETLHKLRVALRQLRALWWAFGPLMDPAQAKHDSENFKRLAGAAGNTRDWDVLGQLLTSDDKIRSVAHSAISAIAEQRQLALSSSRATIKEAEIGALVRTALLGTLGQIEARSDDPVRAFAETRVRKAERALKRQTKHAMRHKHPDYEALHEVRIAGKKFRYLLEFFAPIFTGHHEKAIKRLTTFQRKLGNLNDAVVSEAKLREAPLAQVEENDLQQTLKWMAKHKQRTLRSAQKHLRRMQ